MECNFIYHNLSKIRANGGTVGQKLRKIVISFVASFSPINDLPSVNTYISRVRVTVVAVITVVSVLSVSVLTHSLRISGLDVL